MGALSFVVVWLWTMYNVRSNGSNGDGGENGSMNSRSGMDVNHVTRSPLGGWCGGLFASVPSMACLPRW